jgi:manganese transport protein
MTETAVRAGRPLADPARAGRAGGPGLWRLARHLGPALMVAVGYVDPGNWATGVAAGSAFGMQLLSVVLLASLAGMLLQTLAAKLGVATGRDLAEACRAAYGPPTRIGLWLLCELAICACDLAELLGAAIALKLLLGIPLMLGASLTAADVMLLMGLRRLRLQRLELVTAVILGLVVAALGLELARAHPSATEVGRALLPGPGLILDPGRLYLAVAIVGATVMPHNLYLHSALVKTRTPATPLAARRAALRAAAGASVVALAVAGFANAAIVALAAASFHRAGLGEVSDLAQAYRLLAPLLGPLAALVFALGLLASAQNATVTGTLAGQIVMEGFTDLKLAPWKRRLLTRGLALAPALATLALFGDRAASGLLVLSQAVLSLQLPFALAPLIRFTSDPRMMGPLVNGPLTRTAAWSVCAVVVAADVLLLIRLVAP